jgi:hypothetical protein
VLRDFLDRCRERHENPILKRASELFITLGTFSHLQADYDGFDRPVLAPGRPRA